MIEEIFKAIIRRRKISEHIAWLCRDRVLKTGVKITQPFFRWAWSYVEDYQIAKTHGFIPGWRLRIKKEIMIKILHVQWRIFRLTGASSDD